MARSLDEINQVGFLQVQWSSLCIFVVNKLISRFFCYHHLNLAQMIVITFSRNYWTPLVLNTPRLGYPLYWVTLVLNTLWEWLRNALRTRWRTSCILTKQNYRSKPYCTKLFLQLNFCLKLSTSDCTIKKILILFSYFSANKREELKIKHDFSTKKRFYKLKNYLEKRFLVCRMKFVSDVETSHLFFFVLKVCLVFCLLLSRHRVCFSKIYSSFVARKFLILCYQCLSNK